MNKKIFISLMFYVSSICIAQQITFNKEVELQKFVERGGKVEKTSPNIYKLTYRDGTRRVFNFNTKTNQNNFVEGIDTTIINIWEIDTTKYADMFKFWQQVQVSNSLWAPLPVGDLNKNGRLELYGYTDVIMPNPLGPVKIFERNINGIYQDVFTYDTYTILVKGLGNIKGDENKEITLMSTNDGGTTYFYTIYSNDSISTLPTNFDFLLYLDTLQINNMAFGDWDNNGINDCAFTTSDIWDTTMIAIAEYGDSINNLQELFQFSSIFESVFSGFAIEDFDQDEKTELIISSGPGNVFVIENKEKNEYEIVNQFPFPTPNTYMQTASNDIDGNGKSEFWIGGQDFEEGITVYQCYETDGDNSYKIVARIELRYSVSFAANYIQVTDIDNDGKEELILSSGNIILVLKFVGSPNDHNYKLWYAKLGEATQPGAKFNPVSIADLNGDGKMDLLIPMERYTPSIYYAFSYILRQEKPSSVTESEFKELSFESIKGYPNPFNSASTISFNIIETSIVQLKVYNTLGKEINLLLNKELSPGNYSITWDVNDKNGDSLPSGIYLIVLRTKNSVKAFKSVLLK